MEVIFIIKIICCFPGLKQPTNTLLNVQQGELLIKLVPGIRVDEILVPTACKQQPSTLEKCDPKCWVLAQSTLDHMEIVLSLRRADLEVVLHNLLEQKYEYKKYIIISLCSEMSSDPGVWTVRMKWHPVGNELFPCCTGDNFPATNYIPENWHFWWCKCQNPIDTTVPSTILKHHEIVCIPLLFIHNSLKSLPGLSEDKFIIIIYNNNN